MKRQEVKSDDTTMMLLRLFRIADLLATALHDEFKAQQNLQQTTPKTQN